MERISSPESLHDYMRVTSPRLWMLLGAIAALLVGFIVYASTVTMENTVPIEVEVYQYEVLADDGASEETETHTSLTAYLPHTMKDQVDIGMTVRIGREKRTIVWIGTQADGTNVVDIIFLSAMTMISPYCPL